MKPFRHFTIVAVVVGLPLLTYAQSGIQIGTFSNNDARYSDGCGTVLRQSNSYEKIVFAATGQGTWIKLNGKMTSLKYVSSNQPEKAKKGQRFTEKYSGGGYSIKIDYLVTGFDLDAIKFAAAITLSKTKLEKRVKVHGFSGC